jgi:hypothetical protein
MELLQAGVDREIIARWLGHESVLILRNLPLKRLAADALGEIELMGCSKGSGKRRCNSSWDIGAYQV